MMKLKARGVAFRLRSQTFRRPQDDGPAAVRRPPATGEEPPARIIDSHTHRHFSAIRPDELGNQQAYPDDRRRDTVWLYVLGIVTTLYLLGLLFILFG
jgi:hypothetical protein